MEEYLNRSINEVILEFPQVAEILNGYKIGCVTCSVGSCPLSEIVAIHNLPKEAEEELMKGIEKAIYPDKDDGEVTPRIDE
jgi:iron-sulfur cluster repair protein YtfE (RIC family)